MSSIYRYEPLLDFPMYYGFDAVEGDPDIAKALTEGSELLAFDKTEKRWHRQCWRRRWKPVRLKGHVRRFHDFPGLNGLPVLSARAVDALRDMLEENGEILPVQSELGEYYVYSVTSVVDALDKQHSGIRSSSSVWRYEFQPQRLRDATIFVLPEQQDTVLLTQRFVDRVNETGLRGLFAIPVWPLPENVAWWQIRKQRWREYETEGLPPGKTIRSHAVVLELALQHAQGDPSEEERARVLALIEQIKDLLFDVDSTGPAIGHCQDMEEAPGMVKLFLFCPEADLLVERMRPWLKHLDWPEGFRVLIHYGDISEDAPERYLEI